MPQRRLSTFIFHVWLSCAYVALESKELTRAGTFMVLRGGLWGERERRGRRRGAAGKRKERVGHAVCLLLEILLSRGPNCHTDHVNAYQTLIPVIYGLNTHNYPPWSGFAEAPPPIA